MKNTSIAVVISTLIAIFVEQTNQYSNFKSIHQENVPINIQVQTEIQPQQEEVKKYTEEDLYYLSRIIWSEAGSDWCTDEHQLAVGSVVLNRVVSDIYPDSIKKVVQQRGQYTSYNNRHFRSTPNERTMNNAIYLLEHGSTIPKYVIFQSQGRQGNGTWKKIQNQYFCYLTKE